METRPVKTIVLSFALPAAVTAKLVYEVHVGPVSVPLRALPIPPASSSPPPASSSPPPAASSLLLLFSPGVTVVTVVTVVVTVVAVFVVTVVAVTVATVVVVVFVVTVVAVTVAAAVVVVFVVVVEATQCTVPTQPSESSVNVNAVGEYTVVGSFKNASTVFGHCGFWLLTKDTVGVIPAGQLRARTLFLSLLPHESALIASSATNGSMAMVICNVSLRPFIRGAPLKCATANVFLLSLARFLLPTFSAWPLIPCTRTSPLPF